MGCCNTCTCNCNCGEAEKPRFRIMVDPGHGGADSGAVGTQADGIKNLEKEYNLAFALALEKAIIREGHQCILTRRTDVYTTLWARTNQENKEKPDCFISCHMDSGNPKTAKGVTIWLHHLAPTSYAEWALEVLEGVNPLITSNRAQKLNYGYRSNPQADYHVNRETKSPSMLIEMGFVTSEQNCKEVLLNLDSLATAVARATIRFLEKRAVVVK